MEDILLMQFLKKKGIISEKDIHEFHELTSTSMNMEPIYLSEHTNINKEYIGEQEAKDIVSKMFHIEMGRKYIGEKFDMNKAKEVCDRYRGMIPQHISLCEVYIAINSHYHNYIGLYKMWFDNNAEDKIIQSAIKYWFNDDDCLVDNKVIKYFK